MTLHAERHLSIDVHVPHDHFVRGRREDFEEMLGNLVDNACKWAKARVEVRSSLEFYTAQTQGARIERLLISGGGSKLEGFIDIVRQRIPVTREPGRVFSRVGSQLSLSEDAQNEAEPVLATAVGLAIPWGGAS